MPLATVVVPIYNVEQFVGDCIASLRGQTLEDIQVVCVDDGSTDSSAERARLAAGDDARFVFLERENGGLSAARNTGLAAATGDYVCFLDSDDWYEPDALEKLVDAAAAADLDVLDFSARTVYQSPRARKLHQEDYSFRTPIDGVHDGQALFARYWGMRQYTSSACFHLVRLSLLEEADLRFCEGILHEDELFTPLLYAHASRAAFLDEPLYCRRMREDSIMTRPRSMRNVCSLFRISQLLHAWLLGHVGDCSAAFADAMAQDICYIRDAAFVALQGVDDGEAREYVDGLSGQERIDFDLTVRFVSDQANERLKALEESRALRLGNALVAAPRAVRDAIAMKKS